MNWDAKQNFNYIFLKGKDRRAFAVGTVPKDSQLYGLDEMFQTAEFNKETQMYEFPEGKNKIQVWTPRTEI